MTGYDMICVAPEQWDGLWRRRHHLMTRFARRNRVLFVEPAEFWGLRRGGSARRRVRQNKFLCRPQVNLYVQRPINLLPLGESVAKLGLNVVQSVNEMACGMQVRRVVRQVGFHAPILWAYNRPETKCIISAVTPHLLCYDIFDKYTEMPHLSDQGRVKAQELHVWLMRRADVVFVATPLLYQECLQERKEAVYLVPNGVDMSLFDKASKGKYLPPEDIVGLPKPIVGYVGALYDKVDFNLLNSLALEVSGCSLVFIGPVRVYDPQKRRSWSQLLENHNVFYLGEKRRVELTRYWKAMDVGLIPYDGTNYARYGVPNKMYEYLAAGIPVVTSGIVVGEHFSEVVYCSRTTRDFIGRVSFLAHRDNSDLSLHRKELARTNNWDSRVTEIGRMINGITGLKRSRD